MKFNIYTEKIIRNLAGKVQAGPSGPFFMVFITITGLLFLVFQGCAKVGKPSGGIKDINPPNYVSGSPENRSTNFTGDKIVMTFDEYIQLRDQNREILISPPMKEKPLIRVREKTIRVTFKNELLPQTTYTLNFGNAVSDLNENNVLPDFEYVLSTSNTIDSLSIAGKVINAFNHKPDEEGGILVMLYENLSDSAPLIEIPRYFGRANKNGLFAVNNIHPDTFNVIALKDGNNNMLYDPAIEEIAFLDSLLIITPENVIPQSFIKDTVKIITPAGKPGRGSKQGNAQIKADTVIAPGKLLNALNISLCYFLEESNKVFLTSRKRESSEAFSFVFSRPPFDTLQVTPLNFKPGGDWFMKEATHNNDSITYWITDTVITKLDTLRLKLSYLTTDSAGRFMERIDTVNMRYQTTPGRSVIGRRARIDTTTNRKKVLTLSGSILNRGTLNLNNTIFFVANRPLQKVNPEGIELFKLVDSLLVKQQFTCSKDTFSIRRFWLKSKWEEETQYKLLLKPGSAFDIYGLTNDSIEIKFITQKEEYYGRILLTLGGERYPMVVELLDEKGRVVDSKYVKKPGETIFDYLYPGKYSLKAIFDKNENGKWDTGNYLKHLQPEQIFLITKPVELRSNWDNEVTWIISD